MGFVNDYGQGNLIPKPQPFVPFNGKDIPSSSLSTRTANFVRVSKRVPMTYPSLQPPTAEQPPRARDPASRTSAISGKPHKPQTSQFTAPAPPSRPRGDSTSTNRSNQRPDDISAPQGLTQELLVEPPRVATRRSMRESTPLPVPDIRQSGHRDNPPAIPPLLPPDQETGERILFYGAYLDHHGLPLLNDPAYVQWKRCMIIQQRLKRNLISRRGILLLLLRRQTMDGGVESCWTREEGRREDTCSQVISYGYFNFLGN
jgi:hypothetical protein